jgi:tetratricopeptide (TPR) repeat protein
MKPTYRLPNLNLNLSLNLILILFLSLLLFSACSRQLVSSKLPDAESLDSRGNPMLIGACSRTALNKAPYNEWYAKNYAAYQSDSTTLAQIKPLLRKKNITIFLGSWCGDSKREVPRMLKLLDDCGVKAEQVRLIFVSNHDSVYKQSPQHEESGLNIFRVPTFIITENGKEINRIIESPVATLEKDLLAICRKENYEPHYRGAQQLLSRLAQQTPGNNQLEKMAEAVKPLLQHAGELNSVGYVFLAAKNYEKAIAVFKINTILYPQDANIWDSLAEGLLKSGDKTGAAAAYRKVLELQPANEAAKKALEQLQ